jgi:hypothetical protein
MTAAASTIFALQPSAYAATTWSAGTQITSLPFGHDYPLVEGFFSVCNDGVAVVGMVKLAGDYLYVRDNCRDGKSAVVQWRRADAPDRRWNCRNSHGYMTVVRCNFDWAEVNGILIPGIADGTSNLALDHGNSVWLTQSGSDVTPPNPT